jgi:hypothetical protein
METAIKRIAEILTTGTLLVMGCASTPPPTGALASASAAIGVAHEAGATSAATAVPSLEAARRELEQARALMDKGDNQKAQALLVRSKADADLAASLAREEHARNEADELARRAEALRSQKHF